VTTLMGRMTEFIGVAMRAHSENPSVSAFLITAVLESQRHPELSRTQNEAVVITREFLNWAVNDAIERGELKTDTDVPSLAETLLIVLCGVGFYAGYLRSYQEMQAVTETMRHLLEGAFWERET
jgi:TetR/AcrR family transcriptional repressor of uid operon